MSYHKQGPGSPWSNLAIKLYWKQLGVWELARNTVTNAKPGSPQLTSCTLTILKTNLGKPAHLVMMTSFKIQVWRENAQHEEKDLAVLSLPSKGMKQKIKRRFWNAWLIVSGPNSTEGGNISQNNWRIGEVNTGINVPYASSVRKAGAGIIFQSSG